MLRPVSHFYYLKASNMIQITSQQLEALLSFERLVPALEKAFTEEITAPRRHHHNFPNPEEKIDSTLLLMPAWKAGVYLGIKIVIVSPNNQKFQLPTIQGQYMLFDAHKGTQLAQMDAKVLTVRRTAAASALASQYLSRPDSKSLLLIGTGALAPQLIRAHASVRPIEQVWIWGRNFKKAEALAQSMHNEKWKVVAVEDQKPLLSQADIVSCATMSPAPLVFGSYLKPGQHIDLVGSYLPHTRESDDLAIAMARVYADNLEAAPHESGDLAIPIKKGLLKMKDIQGDLFGLCRNEVGGRKTVEEITLFKSVGHALEDLAAAVLAYNALS